MSSSSSLGKHTVSLQIYLMNCYCHLINVTIVFDLLNIAEEEFEDLCFEIGFELETGNGVDMNMQRLDENSNQVNMEKVEVYKIEVPANRYDLLCLEGISTALRCYIH